MLNFCPRVLVLELINKLEIIRKGKHSPETFIVKDYFRQIATECYILAFIASFIISRDSAVKGT